MEQMHWFLKSSRIFMKISGLWYFFETNLMVPFISMSDLILSRARPKAVVASNPEIYSALHKILWLCNFWRLIWEHPYRCQSLHFHELDNYRTNQADASVPEVCAILRFDIGYSATCGGVTQRSLVHWTRIMQFFGGDTNHKVYENYGLVPTTQPKTTTTNPKLWTLDTQNATLRRQFQLIESGLSVFKF